MNLYFASSYRRVIRKGRIQSASLWARDMKMRNIFMHSSTKERFELISKYYKMIFYLKLAEEALSNIDYYLNRIYSNKLGHYYNELHLID